MDDHAMNAAKRIVPQWVTGYGDAAARLKSVDEMTTLVAGIIQKGIDDAKLELLELMTNKPVGHVIADQELKIRELELEVERLKTKVCEQL